MIVIKFETKWGDRYVASEDREQIFGAMLKERIDDGFWYDIGETLEAQEYISKRTPEAFMHSRRNHEYEGYEEISLEVV